MRVLDEWAAQLPITPDGDTLGIDNVNTGEGANGFGVSGSRAAPTTFDRQLIEETMTAAGFNMRVDLDEDDHWNAIFFPGESQIQSPWTIDFTQTEGGVGFQVSARWMGPLGDWKQSRTCGTPIRKTMRPPSKHRWNASRKPSPNFRTSRRSCGAGGRPALGAFPASKLQGAAAEPGQGPPLAFRTSPRSHRTDFQPTRLR